MRLRPKEDENDPAESKAKKKIFSDSQKRLGEDLEGQPATRTMFTNDAMNASMEEKARMLKKRSAEDDAPGLLKKRLSDDDEAQCPSEDEDVDVGLMEALEDAEEQTLHMTSMDYCIPLITCEESVDISYLDSEQARDLSDAIECTKVGEVRHTLDRCLSQCMMAELCGENISSGLLSTGGASEAELGASIFEYGSQMGVVPDGSGDRWDRDPSTATWTRTIVVARRVSPPQ